MIRIRILTTIAILITPVLSVAQFCSAPQPTFFTSLDYRGLPAKCWQFSLTYDHKSLSKLVSNSTQMEEDDTRSRYTRSTIVGISYGVNDKLVAKAVTNYTQKSVEIRLPAIGREYLRTRGMGDTYLLAEYFLRRWYVEGKDSDKLSIGGGLKIPTGQNDYTSDEIPIREDMQPGTGSWDFLIWANMVNQLTSKSPAFLYAEAGYRLNGENDAIKYGNEIFGSIGLMMLPEYVARFTSYITYRNMSKFKDKSGNIVPDTGGSWLTIIADIKTDITNNIFGRLTMEAPVKNDLNGTQLIADYVITLSFQFTFLNKGSNEDE